MRDTRPGLNSKRILELMTAGIRRCDLRLQGLTVLTEAANGAYVVTPVLAAMAGAAKVYAVARTSRYGTAEQIAEQTWDLARLAGIEYGIEIVCGKQKEIVSRADIVTNSGHVRPIDAETVSWLKPDAVVSLMYEAWEFRPEDVDLNACRQRGILVGGVNERHPSVDVFPFLGIMAVKLLLDAGVAVYKSRILLLCDNAFGPFVESGLASAGAAVTAGGPDTARWSGEPFDAILTALQPRPGPVLSTAELREIARHSPGAVIAQYWGDLDREAVAELGLPIWPADPPRPGHMGILPSAPGPEAIVRLQTGGLKAGEVLFGRWHETDLEAGRFVQIV